MSSRIRVPGAGASRIRVRAPATSANLGPGFDVVGIALDWWDELEVAEAPATAVQVAGPQAELLAVGPDNLVLAAMVRLAAEAGAALPPVHLSIVKAFPLGRGFGSSAAAVVLGLLAARALLAPDLPDAEVFRLAAELEGHPDNVAAALAGGATLCWQEGGQAHAHPIAVHPDLAVLALVAPEPLATSTARALLPGSVAFADAALTAARAALLAPALAGAFDLLLPATEDALHSPPRLARLPATAALLEVLRARGQAAFLSGAGPSLAVLVPRPGLAGAAADAGEALARTPGWQLQVLEVARTGAGVAGAGVADAGAPAPTTRTGRIG